MSEKRILPAMILASFAGFLGAHRFYAGRIYTGLIQLVLFVYGAIKLVPNLSGIFSIQTPDQMQDWVLHHEIQPFPVLLVAIPSFWALIDCILLALGRLKDSKGNRIQRWM